VSLNRLMATEQEIGSVEERAEEEGEEHRRAKRLEDIALAAQHSTAKRAVALREGARRRGGALTSILQSEPSL